MPLPPGKRYYTKDVPTGVVTTSGAAATATTTAGDMEKYYAEVGLAEEETWAPLAEKRKRQERERGKMIWDEAFKRAYQLALSKGYTPEEASVIARMVAEEAVRAYEEGRALLAAWYLEQVSKAAKAKGFKSLEEARKEALAELDKAYRERRSKALEYLDEAEEQLAELEKLYEEKKKEIQAAYEELVRENPYAKEELEKWKKQALEQLEKWYRENKAKIQSYIAEVKKYLAGLDKWYRENRTRIEQATGKQAVEKYRRSMLEWLRTVALPSLRVQVYRKAREHIERLMDWLEKNAEQILARLRATREKVLESIDKYMEQVMDYASKVWDVEEAEKLREKVYSDVYKVLIESGVFTEREARERAEELAGRVYREASRAATKYSLLAKKYRDRLDYEAYRAVVESVALALQVWLQGGTTNIPETLGKRLTDIAGKLAGEMGVPEGLWQRIANQVLEKRIGDADRLFNEAVSVVNSFAEDLNKAARTAAEILESNPAGLDRAYSVLRGVVEKYSARLAGLPAPVQRIIRDYMERQVKRVMDWVERFKAKAREVEERARRIYREYQERYVLGTKESLVHALLNLERLAGELAERVTRELVGLGIERSDAERYARALAENFKREVMARAQSYLQAGRPAVVVRVGDRWRVYWLERGAGRAEFTARTEEEALAHLVGLGAKPLAWIEAGSEEEAREKLKAVLRSLAPEAYMALLGEELFTGRGVAGKTPLEAAYQRAVKLPELATEFLRIPGEKLWERGEKEGGITGAAMKAAGAVAGLAAGIVGTYTGLWDIPGIYRFGYQLATGEVLREAARNPVFAAELVGGLIGAAGLSIAGRSALGAAKARGGALGKIVAAATKPIEIRPFKLTTTPVEVLFTAPLAAGFAMGLAETLSKGVVPLTAMSVAVAVAKEKKPITKAAKKAGEKTVIKIDAELAAYQQRALEGLYNRILEENKPRVVGELPDGRVIVEIKGKRYILDKDLYSNIMTKYEAFQEAVEKLKKHQLENIAKQAVEGLTPEEIKEDASKVLQLLNEVNKALNKLVEAIEEAEERGIPYDEFWALNKVVDVLFGEKGVARELGYGFNDFELPRTVKELYEAKVIKLDDDVYVKMGDKYFRAPKEFMDFYEKLVEKINEYYRLLNEIVEKAEEGRRLSEEGRLDEAYKLYNEVRELLEKAKQLRDEIARMSDDPVLGSLERVGEKEILAALAEARNRWKTEIWAAMREAGIDMQELYRLARSPDVPERLRLWAKAQLQELEYRLKQPDVELEKLKEEYYGDISKPETIEEIQPVKPPEEIGGLEGLEPPKTTPKPPTPPKPPTYYEEELLKGETPPPPPFIPPIPVLGGEGGGAGYAGGAWRPRRGGKLEEYALT